MTEQKNNDFVGYVDNLNTNKHHEEFNHKLSAPGLSKYVKNAGNIKRLNFSATPNDKLLYANDDNSFALMVDKFKQSGKYLTISSLKLLDSLVLGLGQINNYKDEEKNKLLVEMKIEDYMKLIGKKITPSSKKECIKETQINIADISGHQIRWNEKINGKHKSFGFMNIFSSGGYSNGYIRVNFAPEFARYLINSYLSKFPMYILKIDSRKPNAYHCAKKLAEYASMYRNIKAGTFNIISVKSLLEACPDIPTYEEVKEGDRQYTRRIIEPLGNALDYLADMKIIKWCFCNAKKELITDKQLKQDYEELSNCYINFYLVNPDSQKVLEDQSQ